jgi:hypothetical protein
MTFRSSDLISRTKTTGLVRSGLARPPGLALTGFLASDFLDGVPRT